MYPRRLGQAIDCTDPNNFDDAECVGVDDTPVVVTTDPSSYNTTLIPTVVQTTPQLAPVAITPTISPVSVSPVPASGAPGTSLISTILTDVSQFLRPGTPAPQPLYTPTSTSITALLSEPIVLVGIGLAAFLAFSKKRR